VVAVQEWRVVHRYRDGQGLDVLGQQGEQPDYPDALYRRGERPHPVHDHLLAY